MSSDECVAWVSTLLAGEPAGWVIGLIMALAGWQLANIGRWLIDWWLASPEVDARCLGCGAYDCECHHAARR